MHTIQASCVGSALAQGIRLLKERGIDSESRGGKVRTVMSPVMTVYSDPTRRVLLDPVRNANPFFHLFESMWMLAGRDDGTWLDRYVKNFSVRFGEDDQAGRIHGAYGARWRGWFMSSNTEQSSKDLPDQLNIAVKLLRENHNDRQVVVSMWDPRYDLDVVARDRPCNTHIYFRIRNWSDGPSLDMTVCCRSNDMFMGAYGANAVHMSVLQEYIATMVGVSVGNYYQMSNDFHAYERDLIAFAEANDEDSLVSSYDPSPLFTSKGSTTLDVEIRSWCRAPSDRLLNNNPQLFDDLLVPMSQTHDLVYNKHYRKALIEVARVKHKDWREAAKEWIERKIAK